MNPIPPAIMPRMSLIIASKNDEGIVITGDKRAILSGEPNFLYSDKNKKILEINKKVGIGAAGDANDAFPIYKIVTDSKLMGDVDEAADEVCKIVAKYHSQFKTTEFQERVKNNLAKEPEYVFVVAGYTKEGEAKIYDIFSQNIRKMEPIEPFSVQGIRALAHNDMVLGMPLAKTLKQLKNLCEQTMNHISGFSYGVSPKFNTIVIPKP